MPLYNNILSSKKGEQNAPSISGASSSMKLLQDHLMSKKRSKPLIVPTKLNKQSDRSQIILESTLHHKSENNWNPQDDYDPMVPNSYEVLKAEQRKAEEQRLANRKTIGKLNPSILDVLDKLDDDDDYSSERSPSNKGIAIAPPSSLQSSAMPSEGTRRGSDASPMINKTGDKLEASVAAANIMSKMGYKAGQGLGKDEQGISCPLEVDRSGLNSGRIVQKPAATDKGTSSPVETKPTRVLLLQNMVGPGEVDDDLEAETKEECKKYGHVIKCLIYEIPNKRVADDEAVRIFVEFERAESAVKASNDLNGRYFGGRVVKTSFYDPDKFLRYELGP